MTPFDTLLAVVVVVLWGVNMVAVKLGTAGLPPFLLTAIRFTLVAAMLLPFAPLPRGRIKGLLIVSTVLGVLHFGLLFAGIAGTDAASASIAVQLSAPFSALLAWLAFGERLGWRRGAGMALAFAGVAVLAGEPSHAAFPALALVVAGAGFWAVGNVFVKRLGSIQPVAINAWMALFAAPQLLVVSLVVEHGQLDAIRNAGWVPWAAVGFTAVGSTVVAYTLWYHLIRKYPINQVVPFSLLGPVIGVASGVLILGERLTWYKGAGGLLTLAGVAVIQFNQPRAAQPAPFPAAQDAKP